MDNIKNNIDKKQKQQGIMTRQLGFGLSLSGWIAFPVLCGFFLGNFLVDKINAPQYVFLICVIGSVVFSFYGLIKESKKYLRSLVNSEDEEKSRKENDVQSIRELSYHDIHLEDTDTKNN